MPRFASVVMAAVLLVACRGTDLQLSLPHSEDIPADAVFIYRFDPTLLTYDFVDSTQLGQVHLRWLPPSARTPFTGYTCFALTPRTPTDTIGSFVFIARSANSGYLERKIPAAVDSTTDTTAAYFLTGLEGSRGTYALDSQGTLRLSWSNGQQLRYFDPAATLRIATGLLTSDVTLRYSADSVTATWGVGWVSGPC
jgi:hypothetical protein